MGATVSGGSTNFAFGLWSTTGGGHSNIADTIGAVVAGGYLNAARGAYSFVGGGGGQAALDSNSAHGRNSVVAGGARNFAGHDYSAVGGGVGDRITGVLSKASMISGGDSNEVRSKWSVIAGGKDNEISSGATGALVGCGRDNSASGTWSVVVGGTNNATSATHAVVGGGSANRAWGSYATVPGGERNKADGDVAFAAGHQAQAIHNGTVVIAANSRNLSSDSIRTSGRGQMVLRADGHFYLTDQAGDASIPAGDFLNTSTGAHLTTGGVWTNSSDANQKENFSAVDAAALLDQLARLPISEWNYKSESDAVRHIGPTAQDFYALFGVGTDDKSIATVDPAGIALAAIKQLAKENAELRSQLEDLRRLVEQVIEHQ